MSVAGEKDEESQVATCRFVIQRKRRFCKASPLLGKSYCVEHSHLEVREFNSFIGVAIIQRMNQSWNSAVDNRKRIPCPMDPKHTVFEDRLEKHMKKCNARPKDQPPYHFPNRNSGSNGTNESPTFQFNLKDVADEELIIFTERVTKIYNDLNLKIEDFGGLCHEVIADELSSGVSETKRGRHLSQVGALLAMLQDKELLAPHTVFLEFGAGRGELAHWIQRSLPADSDSIYILVDRASPRHKFDLKHKWGDGPRFHRLRIDIEHLDLSKVESIPSNYPLLCVSKHLCGDATDLTLRCLVNFETAAVPQQQLSEDGNRANFSSESDSACTSPKRRCLDAGFRRVGGVLVALCCHHRCSWAQFCGREAFQELGLTSRDFHLLTRIGTWATCGAKEDSEDVHPRFRKLNATDRKEIGRKCKRLIDYGRLKFLERRFPHVTLCHFVDEKESLENVALFAYH